MPITYGNGIKRPNQQVQFTQQMVLEYAKCAKDVRYFAENYYYILHPTRGKMLIELYDFQKEMIKNFQDNRFNIVLSARQMGKTTCSCIYLLWFAIFNPEKTVAILANKQRTAKSIVDDIKAAYRELPDWMKPGITKWDGLNLEFDNESRVFSAATSEDALRGESISLLFLDEFAFVPENVADGFWASNFPTVSTGGNIIIVSTPNGTAGLFYDLYQAARNPTSPWNRIRVKWDQHPDRDEQWKNDMLHSIGKVRFAQEFDCSFTGSTYTLIEADVLSNIIPKEPIFYPRDGLHIWKRPEQRRLYLIGVDVAKGANSDYSVANLYDCTTWHKDGRYEQVAILRRNDLSVFDFMKELKLLAKDYGNPAIIVENNHLGSVLANQMYFEEEYENIYYDYEKGEYGVNANIRTKPLALTYFKDDIESGKMIIHSEAMIKELNYFEEVRTGIFKAREGRGFHDDTVASGYWVSYCLRSSFWEDQIHFRLKDENNNTLIQENSDNSDEETLEAFNNFMNNTDYFDIKKEFRNF